MSRLYDRVMAQGCEPLTAWHIIGGASDPDERRRAAETVLEEVLGRPPSDREISAQLVRHRRATAQLVSSVERYEPVEFEGAVVISAEEVADFWATLPSGTVTTDITDRLAPPFERSFVEFQGRSNTFGLKSWGVLIEGRKYEGAPRAEFKDQGWELACVLVGEWEKSRPVGPFQRWLIPLDSAGYPYPGDEEGHGSFFAFPLTFGGEPPPEDLEIDGALNTCSAQRSSRFR